MARLVPHMSKVCKLLGLLLLAVSVLSAQSTDVLLRFIFCNAFWFRSVKNLCPFERNIVQSLCYLMRISSFRVFQ